MRQTVTIRWWWFGLLLTLLHFTVASQGDSAVVQVVRVIDGGWCNSGIFSLWRRGPELPQKEAARF